MLITAAATKATMVDTSTGSGMMDITMAIMAVRTGIIMRGGTTDTTTRIGGDAKFADGVGSGKQNKKREGPTPKFLPEMRQ